MTVSSVQSEVIAITGELSTDSYLQLYCVLKLDKPGSLLQMKTKRNDNKKGFLHISLYQQGESSLLGHLDVSEPTSVWNTVNICPTGLNNNQTTNAMLLSVVGKGRGLSFTVQIAEHVSEIALDKPHPVDVQRDKVSVFQFIPSQDISDKQLDITVTSQSKVAAYLKVSQNCKEVDLQKDLESIDYKKECLRLSFATKGRITLSRFSAPPLNDSVSRWFIGIGLKNLGNVKFNESKHVTLTLTRSYDYNYVTPICGLILLSLFGGILVSIIALWLFEESLTKFGGEDNRSRELRELPSGNQDSNRNDTSNKLKWYQKWRKCISDMLTVAKDHWFCHGPKTFSYITGIVGSVLMVGSFQFVFANWRMMIREGDRDNCYYNDFCYRVIDHDIPFNLMISNLGYIIHGFILTICVLRLETKLYLQILEKFSGTAEEMKKRYCFSIGYAFSWGLIFEGLFSTLYHFCPSRLTFQFDSAFMFIIAGLTILLLYNCFENVNYPVSASNFFLFFIVPLFIFNYFGALYNSHSELNKVHQGLFFGLLIIWWLMMVYWAFYKLNINDQIKFCSTDSCESICNTFLFILGGLLVPCGLFMIFLLRDLAQVFLFACIACSVVAILAKARLWEKLPALGGLCNECCCEHECNCSLKETCRRLFILFTFITLIAAFSVFKFLPTTNKTSLPENSRDMNEECAILGFFDWHALWHLLSSFALLMGAFVVMFISSES
ncbi:SID1 transmembrane family member 1 [Stylophora pistillata]|uniref:SID1 transmembrane family member 1 n=2 Tax=Stylophora pistillata TaxID=50429 RepID=A0A2B4ST05_STYPI|nr:SID1 transmembrane family member 1 [Stylophora pistillata]